MKNRMQAIKLSFVSLFIFACAAIVFAYSSGPPAAHTGAPGENSCVECHNSFPVNSGGGSITLSGLPQSYTPGKRYTITATVSQADKQRWGFQATVRAADGSMAGTLEVSDSSLTQLISDNNGGKPSSYIEHTASGTQRGRQSSGNFTFNWVAPASDIGAVTFYAAGNAANGDNTTNGDNIYTTSAQLAAAASSQPSAPVITNITAKVSSTIKLKIAGKFFQPGATVTINGAPVNAAVKSDRLIVAKKLNITLAGTSISVAVHNPDGTVSSDFTITP